KRRSSSSTVPKNAANASSDSANVPRARRIPRMTLDTTLLHPTRRITPVIRAHRAHAERDRCLSAPVVDAMAEAGLWRLGVPRSPGGLEVDPLTCARVVEEVALADSVVGWALTNPMIFAWSCARLSDAGAETVIRRSPQCIIV